MFRNRLIVIALVSLTTFSCKPDDNQTKSQSQETMKDKHSFSNTGQELDWKIESSDAVTVSNIQIEIAEA